MRKSAEVLDSIPRKVLAAGEAGAKPLRKPLAVDLGSAIERALSIAGLTKKDVSYRMGYGTNQAPISRWIAGTEMPQLSKLWAIEELRGPLVVALAEAVDDSGVVVTTNIEVRTKRTA